MGTVLKVVSIPRGSWHDLEEILLEEMTVFRVAYTHLYSIQLNVHYISTYLLLIQLRYDDNPNVSQLSYVFVQLFMYFLPGTSCYYSDETLYEAGN